MSISFPNERTLDAIALGRAGVDLYVREPGVSLEAASGFEKFVGGSPANIVAALSKLGSKTGFIGKVSDDSFGHYVVNYLKQIGVDISHIRLDTSGSRTSLAIAEMKPDDCEVLFYRNAPADLLLGPSEIDEAYIRQAKALIISGTALSRSPSREAVFMALNWAQKHGTKTFLDIDYRPYSWASLEETSIYYNLAAEKCDVVIGNREEFDAMEAFVLPDNQDDQRSAERIFRHQPEIVIIKHGKDGSNVFTRDGQQFHCGVFPVNLVKPYGAGDAFAGALIHMLLQGNPLQKAVEAGAAAASIVVSSQSCSEASPTLPEIEDFIQLCRGGKIYQKAGWR